MLDYTEELKKCVHEDEVWALMKNKIYTNSNNSAFGDETLFIRRNALAFFPVTPPLGLIGLAYRTFLYLRLDGEAGSAPVNGGNYSTASNFLRTIRELQEYGNFDTPSQLTGKILDAYIVAQRKSGNTEGTIRTKLFHFEKWLAYGHLFPFFLRLPHDLIMSCKEWERVVEGSSKEKLDYQNGLGGSKEPYPLDQWVIIITEAIDYIDNYAEDCVIAAQLYKEFEAQNRGQAVTMKYATKHFRIINHRFSEPLLATVQHHALSLPNNQWKSMPKNKGIGPVGACLTSIHKLQAACVIIVLILTAMRKGELGIMMRYPRTKKTAHHELDGSIKLERLVYKTAETDQGELHPIAVPQIITHSLNLLSRISEIGDGKREGLINLMTLHYGKAINNAGRINYLIQSFCDDLDITPPAPHQLRHALAFLVAFLNDDIGIELAMTLLGHKSTEMTKKYMGHYKQVILETFGVMFDENVQIREAVAELQAEQSSQALEKIIAAVENDKPLSGPIVKRLLQGVEFAGSLTNEGKVFFAKSQRLLLERGMLAIVEHPTHFCVRDLTDPAPAPCHIGLVTDDFINVPVVSAQCQTSCGCRLYTEPKVEEMKRLSNEMEEHYPDDLLELIKGNRYYIANSFEQTYGNVIKEFEQKKQQKEKQHG
ncbi:hypothetical protein [Sulfuricurvum sp.]|uniref:hypothetical protein n=1 Tax=Sulfuricurvum sp. TaxID=2025608 RepID=UPI002612A5CE|nr:hypothetical protein [Sulfuricurvum sp.]MDD2265467.1 hypothetical protein [Sulfuricurvum sp.]MDD2782876.1 hypothetical protein [Sulfuricurvum sp.]